MPFVSLRDFALDLSHRYRIVVLTTRYTME
jgi:hypothetical protein